MYCGTFIFFYLTIYIRFCVEGLYEAIVFNCILYLYYYMLYNTYILHYTQNMTHCSYLYCVFHMYIYY